MGQLQSQHKAPLQNREPTPEPLDPEEAARFREEKARQQAEDRARRAAAAEERFSSQQKKGASGGGSGPNAGVPKKKESALQQMSRENKGWRDADAQADLRAYN